MANEGLSVKVTAKVRIMKYTDGGTEPYEIIEKEEVLVGEEAEKLLKGVDTNAIN